MPMYTMGCKRVLISDDFYPTMNRPNVELVTTPIRAVRPTGIVTTDGAGEARRCDHLRHRFPAIRHHRRHASGGPRRPQTGGRLAGWAGRLFTGVTVAGYPNFFLLMGPNSALGHNSIIFMIEAQVRYIIQCLSWLDEGAAGGKLESVEGTGGRSAEGLQCHAAKEVRPRRVEK